jgi:protoporphyrinogen oxidase
MRIPDPPVEDIIKSSLGIRTEGYIHQMNFYYPIHNGIEALIKSIEKEISNHVTHNFEAKHLKLENGKWIVTNENQSRSFDKLVSTIPLQHLCSAVNAPSEVMRAARKLQYNSLITVMIGTNKDKINGMTWLYIPDKKILTHSISFPSNFSPEVAPKGKSSVLVEITCRLNDEIWKMNDEELKHRVINDLHELKILDGKDVCFSAVRRLEFAYVINDLDYEDNLRFIKGYFDKEEISLVGRFAEFKYLNMDNCMENALNWVKGSNLS